MPCLCKQCRSRSVGFGRSQLISWLWKKPTDLDLHCLSLYEFVSTTQIKQYDWRGGWVRQRCPVAFVTRATNWYWLTVGQGLLSLQQVRVDDECCYFFCSFTFFHFPLSSLSLFFISSTVSSISFLPLSGRWHKMTHKGWCVVKPKHNMIGWKLEVAMAS